MKHTTGLPRRPKNYWAPRNDEGGIASTATRSVLTGTDFGDNIVAILPNALDQTIGNALAYQISQGSNSASQAQNEPGAGDGTADLNTNIVNLGPTHLPSLLDSLSTDPYLNWSPGTPDNVPSIDPQIAYDPSVVFIGHGNTSVGSIYEAAPPSPAFNLHADDQAIANSQNNFCYTDPFWKSIANSQSFSVIEKLLISDYNANGNEWGVTHYSLLGYRFYGTPYTSNNPEVVGVPTLAGGAGIGADAIFHTHPTYSGVGLSKIDRQTSNLLSVPSMVIKVNSNGPPTLYCHSPKSK